MRYVIYKGEGGECILIVPNGVERCSWSEEDPQEVMMMQKTGTGKKNSGCVHMKNEKGNYYFTRF